MSGIYIPGLAMPTNCLDCPVYWDKCPNFETEGEEYLDRIHPDCPLVSVPEHGRLIDADALKAKQQEDADLFIGSPVDVERRDEALNAVANIVNAPTIIPADGNLYDSLRRGLEQAINGESRSETIPERRERDE